MLDTSAWAQLGPMADVVRTTQAHKAVLDHHVDSDDLGAELFKDTKAEATGRLVLEAAKHLRVKLTPELARPLFAAIATDTGWFRFASVTGDTFRVPAALVDAGAVPQQIYTDLYERETLARLQLRGRILRALRPNSTAAWPTPRRCARIFRPPARWPPTPKTW